MYIYWTRIYGQPVRNSDDEDGLGVFGALQIFLSSDFIYFGVPCCLCFRWCRR